MTIRSGLTSSGVLLATLWVACNSANVVADDGEWQRLFNGTDFDGWTANAENPDSFVVEGGVIKAKGPRTHLFYSGAHQDLTSRKPRSCDSCAFPSSAVRAMAYTVAD